MEQDDGHPQRPDHTLPAFRGFREMARRRRRLVRDLTARRQRLGLSQAEVAARMGTSQSAVARLESHAGDVRLSTVERYAAAVGQSLELRLADAERPSQTESG